MGFVRNLTGKTSAKAAIRGGEIQSEAATLAADQVGVAGQEAGSLVRNAGGISQRLIQQGGKQAGALLDPFQQVGQQGIDQAGFLTDPQAQFDFLQNNPLFQLGLDNANRQTSQLAASRGRLSSGDTLTQLNNNALLTASPLIAQQKQSIGDLLNLGQSTALSQGGILQNTAGGRSNIIQNSALNQANILQGTAANQGNLLTGAAAAEAAGLVGAANARSQGAGNILQLAGQIGGAAIGAFGGPTITQTGTRLAP
jgi:hypothetical protein